MSRHWRKHAVATLSTLLLPAFGCLSPAGADDVPVNWQSPNSALPPASATQASATTTWPLRIDSPYGTINIYEPQPEKLEADHLTARAALSVVPPGETEPQFGTMW